MTHPPLAVPPIVTLLAVVLGAGLAGCAAAPPAVVATDAVFPPFHFVDDAGELAGHDVELAREALRRAGERPRVVQGPSFRALFEGLERGDYDVIAATCGITPERQARYGFTRPYYVTSLGVIVRDAPGAPASIADLAGRHIAAAAGTTSAAAARRIPGATVVETTRARDSLDAVRSGAVDAMIIDEFEAVPFARADAALRVLPEPAALESYGLVLRRHDVERRRRLDVAITAMEADGTLAALRARFGLERPSDWPIRAPE